MLDRPEREAARREKHRREADREQVDRERPDDVETAREDAVGEPAEEARDDRDHGREHAGQERGRDADHQRVAATVEQPGRDVAALGVGAEEVVGRIPRRPDRGHAEPEPAGGLLHHRHRLPVHDRRAVEVRAERIGVGDVVRVDRRGEADEHDQHEDAEQRPARSGCAAAGAGRAPTDRRRGDAGAAGSAGGTPPTTASVTGS